MRLSAKMPALRTLVADPDVARNRPDVTRNRPDVTRNRPHVTRDRPHVTLFFGDPFRILARASPCYAFLVPMLRFFVSMLRFCVPPLRVFFLPQHASGRFLQNSDISGGTRAPANPLRLLREASRHKRNAEPLGSLL